MAVSAPGFHKLPVEVVQRVVDFLAGEESFCWQEIRHTPSARLLDDVSKPLKSISLTCHSLRSLVFPILFRSLRIGFDVLLPETSKAEDRLRGLSRLSTFIEKHSLAGELRGLTVYIPLQSEVRSHYFQDYLQDVVRFALEEVNPVSLTLIGSASSLGSLLSIHVSDLDTWAFGERLQILQLKQPLHLARQRGSVDVRAHCSLLQQRPWTDMTLNEGSSLKVYSTYEYQFKKPPSIICWKNDHQSARQFFLLFPQLRHISYMAIFPLPHHIAKFARALWYLPQLVSLFTQFTPASDAQNNILEDASEVGKANISDVWMEAAHACRVLAFELKMKGRFSTLRRWTTTDEKIQFDEIVGSVLEGWEKKETRVWERISFDMKEEESLPSDR